MKLYWTILIASVITGANLSAGTITGRVHAEGKAGADQDVNCGPDAYQSHALKTAVRVDYAAMHEFIVYIKGPVGTNNPVAPEKHVEVRTEKVSQHHAVFVPHVLPIVKGTTVEWPNNDDIYHNVFSYSEARPFDLGLFKAPEVKPVTFDTPGRVDVFCSIHASMSCVVLVLENPFFASTNDKGVYVITNVPPGTYQLEAWHERLPCQRRQITVPENGEVKADFTLGIIGLPKF
jgi:plastocyanin